MTAESETGSASTAAPPALPSNLNERVALAEQLREEGNNDFKAQKTQEAQRTYEKALTLLRLPGDGSTEDLEARARGLRVPLLLNLALCCLRADPCEACKALEHCEEALDLEPENAKAMYRKAKALIELDELKEAEWELVRACKHMPQDPAPRKDLQNLRTRMRNSLAKERATYEGLFARGPGFASENRETAPVSSSKISERDLNDIYFHDDKENPFEHSEHPEEEARSLQVEGQLEDAVLAWEAAVAQSASREDWPCHFRQCLDFGRLFMDLNMDRLALRCFSKVLEPPVPSGAGESVSSDQPAAPAPAAATRRHALVLKAVCLLNEAEGDPAAEVSACLAEWLRAFPEGGPEEGQASLEERLQSLAESKGTGPACADAAVALGLLDLLGGKATATGRFAEALRIEEPASCFGLAVKWNMLGAVLANRKRYDNALVAYTQALGYQPKYPRALINRGLSLTGLGRHAEAAAAHAEALRLLPSWGGETTWPLLAKAAEDQTEVQELSDSVAAKNLTRVSNLLRSWNLTPPSPAESATEVLARLDLS